MANQRSMSWLLSRGLAMEVLSTAEHGTIVFTPAPISTQFSATLPLGMGDYALP